MVPDLQHMVLGVFGEVSVPKNGYQLLIPTYEPLDNSRLYTSLR